MNAELCSGILGIAIGSIFGNIVLLLMLRKGKA